MLPLCVYCDNGVNLFSIEKVKEMQSGFLHPEGLMLTRKP